MVQFLLYMYYNLKYKMKMLNSMHCSVPHYCYIAILLLFLNKFAHRVKNFCVNHSLG